jgi:hypothetical protein
MSPRAEAIRKAMAQCDHTKVEVDSCSKEWALAHNAYNAAVTEQPRKGRRSGTDLEDLRRHAEGAYEALLDALRIHSDNLAHLAALKGRL